MVLFASLTGCLDASYGSGLASLPTFTADFSESCQSFTQHVLCPAKDFQSVPVDKVLREDSVNLKITLQSSSPSIRKQLLGAISS